MDHAERACAPIQAGERSTILDALRGWALLGILVSNMVGFSGYYFFASETRAGLPFADWDSAAEFVIEWLVTGKFYAIFSLLFGIGFAIQLGRLEARGEGVPRYLRRLGLLFLIGLLHMLLIWNGDILALYAAMGALLLLFRRASDRALFCWAIGLWLFPILWSAAIQFAAFDPAEPIRSGGRAMMAAAGIDVSNGPFRYRAGPAFWPHLAAHPGEILLRIGRLVGEMRFTKVLAMFLIGLWIGRRALYARLDDARPLLVRAARWGIAIGLPLAALKAWLILNANDDPIRLFLAECAYCVSTPLLAIGYSASFALLWHSGHRRVAGWAAPAGRMALTNYLGQSVAQSLIFYGYALGLIGKLGLIFVFPISLALFAVQVAGSRWWLDRFRFGPMEWVWRSLTYGRAQPMLLQARLV